MTTFEIGYITYEDIMLLLQPYGSSRKDKLYAKEIRQLTIKQVIIAKDEKSAYEKFITHKILDSSLHICYDLYQYMAPEILMPVPILKSLGYVYVCDLGSHEYQDGVKSLYYGDVLDFQSVKSLKDNILKNKNS